MASRRFSRFMSVRSLGTAAFANLYDDEEGEDAVTIIPKMLRRNREKKCLPVLICLGVTVVLTGVGVALGLFFTNKNKNQQSAAPSAENVSTDNEASASEIDVICAPSRIDSASATDLASCQEACEGASCCWEGDTVPEDCPADICSEYAACAILKEQKGTGKDAGGADVGANGEDHSQSESDWGPPSAPKDIASLCAEDRIATDDGFAECEAECLRAAGCWPDSYDQLGIDNYFVGNEGRCDDFSACEIVRGDMGSEWGGVGIGGMTDDLVVGNDSFDRERPNGSEEELLEEYGILNDEDEESTDAVLEPMQDDEPLLATSEGAVKEDLTGSTTTNTPTETEITHSASPPSSSSRTNGTAPADEHTDDEADVHGEIIPPNVTNVPGDVPSQNNTSTNDEAGVGTNDPDDLPQNPNTTSPASVAGASDPMATAEDLEETQQLQEQNETAFGSIEEVCSTDNLEANPFSGVEECTEACSARPCCFVEGDEWNCSEDEEEWCEEYALCRTANITFTVKESVDAALRLPGGGSSMSEACSADMLGTFDGLNDSWRNCNYACSVKECCETKCEGVIDEDQDEYCQEYYMCHSITSFFTVLRKGN